MLELAPPLCGCQGWWCRLRSTAKRARSSRRSASVSALVPPVGASSSAVSSAAAVLSSSSSWLSPSSSSSGKMPTIGAAWFRVNPAGFCRPRLRNSALIDSGLLPLVPSPLVALALMLVVDGVCPCSSAAVSSVPPPVSPPLCPHEAAAQVSVSSSCGCGGGLRVAWLVAACWLEGGVGRPARPLVAAAAVLAVASWSSCSPCRRPLCRGRRLPCCCCRRGLVVLLRGRLSQLCGLPDVCLHLRPVWYPPLCRLCPSRAWWPRTPPSKTLVAEEVAARARQMGHGTNCGA